MVNDMHTRRRRQESLTCMHKQPSTSIVVQAYFSTMENWIFKIILGLFADPVATSPGGPWTTG